MRYIDPNAAWEVTREWEQEGIKKFAAYAQNKLQEYAKNGAKINCADLALVVLVGYASENGLSLQLTSADGKFSFDSNSDDYNSVGDFLNGTKNAEGDKVQGVLSLSVAGGDIQANSFFVNKSDRLFWTNCPCSQL